ncbi:putative 1-acylglycerol-3-phosphate O-acyltransferase [Rosa chinensis]|uniref:Putative 1-acylglycerol-3-phosphate O-acyltransferase n=1 Tax=Rosa chinensis TaxID=74649 RepID=A0A2P6RZM9_ROSCH|nr:1-acyl-sn-glycerol-3-phosphate acyltransferase 2 isoform X1 [Rosa chinensis]PRQ51882.1 putative 1-acylglycerol-3-phosphate O-acyltransferase [Rosa chinensis]
MVLPMAIALGILFSVVVVLHPLILHLIPVVLLCVSGLFANLVQAFCFVCIWPISKNAYARINGVVKELDWRVLLGLIDWCAGVKILECVELETSQLKGEEHELVISNARNGADPLLELVLAQWSGCLGSLLAVIKTSARYIPVIGWSMWFSGYVFSGRSCDQDARKLKSDLKDFPQPFWLSVVLERTGFTQGELLAAQRLPVPSKVLSPDTKDLVYAVRRAYSVVSAIYVITVAIPETSPPPTLESVIKGGPSVVHVYIKQHATKKCSETDDAVKKWCTEILAAKIAEQTFGNKGLQAIGRSLKCFLVVISLIVLGSLKFNFVCCSTLLVLSAALFTGRVLTLFGCGVLSLLQCFMEAAIANISWSEHLKPICGWLIDILGELLSTLPCDRPWL